MLTIGVDAASATSAAELSHTFQMGIEERNVNLH